MPLVLPMLCNRKVRHSTCWPVNWICGWTLVYWSRGKMRKYGVQPLPRTYQRLSKKDQGLPLTCCLGWGSWIWTGAVPGVILPQGVVPYLQLTPYRIWELELHVLVCTCIYMYAETRRAMQPTAQGQKAHSSLTYTVCLYSDVASTPLKIHRSIILSPWWAVRSVTQ